MLDDSFPCPLAHGPFDGLFNLPDGFLFGFFLRHCVSRIAAEQPRFSMALWPTGTEPARTRRASGAVTFGSRESRRRGAAGMAAGECVKKVRQPPYVPCASPLRRA